MIWNEREGNSPEDIWGQFSSAIEVRPRAIEQRILRRSLIDSPRGGSLLKWERAVSAFEFLNRKLFFKIENCIVRLH
jgi:hypothetical protein